MVVVVVVVVGAEIELVSPSSSERAVSNGHGAYTF